MYDSTRLFYYLRKLLWVNAILAVALATGIWSFLPSMSTFRAASIAVIVVSMLLFALGETQLFPRLCRMPVVWRMFPNIDGDYNVEISSNWAQIRARSEDHSSNVTGNGNVSLFKKVGTARISCRLTCIDMRMEMDDEHMTSETISCSLQSAPGKRNKNLYYVYESRISVPNGTDSDRHLGAGRLTIPEERRPTILRGNYWTDRNWHKGSNTAGQVVLRRV